MNNHTKLLIGFAFLLSNFVTTLVVTSIVKTNDINLTVEVDLKKADFNPSLIVPIDMLERPSTQSLPVTYKERKVIKEKAIELISKYRVLTLINKSTDSLSDWQKFQKGVYLMAVDIKQIYPIALDTIGLYDSFMKTAYAECKFAVGIGAINKISDARGVWQFMPKYRARHNVPENVHTLPLYKQVKYMYEYARYKLDNQWTTNKGGSINTTKIDDFIDVYCLIFAPKYTDDPDHVTLYAKCKKPKACKYSRKGKGRRCAYHANQGYDRNKNGLISKGEVGKYILNKHYKHLKNKFK